MATHLEILTKTLISTIHKLKSGELDVNIGNAINKTAHQAIKAQVHEQQLTIRVESEVNKTRHIKLQCAKLKLSEKETSKIIN